MTFKRTLVAGTFVIILVALTVFHLSNDTSTAFVGDVNWKSFDAAMAVSQSQGKRILVDVYTSWCSWCKKMDKEVYTDPSVVAAIQSYFIPVKLNAESGAQVTFDGRKLTEAQFAKAMGVSGYPTTVFFETDGKPITVVPGYIPASDFANILEFIGADHYRTSSYEAFLSSRGKNK